MNNPYYNNKKLALSLGWIAFGAILLYLSFRNIIVEESMCWFGGFLIAIGGLQVRNQLRYRTDPDFRKKTDVEAADERNRYLRMKAWSWTGYIFVVGAGVLVICLQLIGKKDASVLLSYCVCAELMIYLVSYWILGRRY